MKNIVIIIFLVYSSILPAKQLKSGLISDINFLPLKDDSTAQKVLDSTKNTTRLNSDSTQTDSSLTQSDSSKFVNYGVNLLWKQELESTVTVLPLVWKNRLYITEKNGYISCYDSTGKQIWKSFTSERIVSQPAIADNYLAVGTMDGDIISLNIKTGKMEQTIGLGEPVTAPLIAFNYKGARDIIIDNDVSSQSIIIGTESGKVYCYDISSFGFLWESDVSKAAIQTKPIYKDNKVIFLNDDGNMYCLDSRSGILIWKWQDKKTPYAYSFNNSPVSDGNNVYVSPSEKSLFAVDVLLGKSNWFKDIIPGILSFNLSTDSTKLLINSSANKFFYISASDGKIIKELVPISTIDTNTCKPIEVNGNIISGSGEGKIFLIDSTFNQKPLLYLGNTGILSIQQVTDKIVAAVTNDGKVYAFKME